MKIVTCGLRPAVVLSICLVFLVACNTTTSRNFEARGAPASQAEIVQHFSGKFVKTGEGGTYLGIDGSLKGIDPAGGSPISIGSWSAGNALCFTLVYYGKQNGQTASSGEEETCYLIWINPDGTSIADPVGSGANLDIAKPVPGFPIENRFNALRAELGV
ncbi:hypothetical protein PEL8287_03403 [Roseovarius litorisediminis]|uniref:Lipoprotein n=1 Tax=Roseovarius litorisediminis TaxID=1312363 RepID=A0A1Y5TES8_9RHOB|nr:hypothetical protein [Roseovarius litorisediminis]SLN62437.1 hypothetical protein PEL8287_03403 [Roseovarius litorisediminis]